MRVLSAVSLAQDAASELLYPVLPIFLTTVLGAPAVAVGVIEGLADATTAVAKLVAGRLADHRARRPLIGLGYGLAGITKAPTWRLPGCGRWCSGPACSTDWARASAAPVMRCWPTARHPSTWAGHSASTAPPIPPVR